MAIGHSTAADLITRATAVGIDLHAEIVRTGQTAPQTIAQIQASAERNWAPELVTAERIAARYAAGVADKIAMFTMRQGDALETVISGREAVAARTMAATAQPGWSRAGTTAGHGRGTCDNCGGLGSAHPRHDSSGIAGRVCGRCVVADQSELAFA